LLSPSYLDLISELKHSLLFKMVNGVTEKVDHLMTKINRIENHIFQTRPKMQVIHFLHQIKTVLVFVIIFYLMK
jgi:hypothetical protein